LFLFIFLLVGGISWAQSGPGRPAPPNTKVVTQKLDAPPRYQGGIEKLSAVINQNLQYPEEAQKQKITGSVLVGFYVEEDGQMTDLKVLQPLGAGCDEEALRVVGLLTEWLPGKIRNKPVRAQVQLPIPFGASKNLEVEKRKGSKVTFQ
jgi:periplasmic protein TonB